MLCARKSQRRDRHDDDLRALDRLQNAGLVVPVGQLTGNAREQHVGQDEQPGGDVGQQLGVEFRVARGVVRCDDDQHVLINVVVEGAERLRAEEWQEASLLQQPELRTVGWLWGHARFRFSYCCRP